MDLFYIKPDQDLSITLTKWYEVLKYNLKKLINGVVTIIMLMLYCKIKYFGGKQIEYVVNEHFTDTFSINIFATSLDVAI